MEEIDWTEATLNLDGIGEVVGLFYDGRISPTYQTPKPNKYWLRHDDFGDFTDIASLKNGFIMVNFAGMFITDEPINIKPNDEIEVLQYNIKY